MTESRLVCDPRQTIPSAVILPVECIDHIIGYLEFDKATLQRCALVCHLWAYLCQQRLFNHLYVRIFVESAQLDSERARQLLEILSRSSHIGEHIRSLQLTVCNVLFQGSHQTRQFSAEQHALSQVLSQIHRLSSMSLNGPGDCGFDFAPPLLKALESTLTSPQLSHLSLSGWNLADLKEITSLMGNYSWSLESLRLYQIYFGDPTNDEKAPNSEFITTINILEVNSCDLLKIANWIQSINISPHVKKLILVNVDGENDLSFIDLFSSHLEELTLSCFSCKFRSSALPTCITVDNLTVPLNFSDLPALRVLSLNEWALDHLLEGLETFRRNNYLETLDIATTVDGNVVSKLTKLDRLLSSIHAFPSLKLVKINIQVQSTETCEAVKEALVLLLERGLLRLEVDVIPRQACPSQGAGLFSSDFISSVASTLDDFDSSFRPDGERDFGRWFNGDDAMGGLS